MQTILFIGLGTMGFPLATRIAKAGYDLAVSDANPDVVSRVAGATGATALASPLDGADRSVVILSLPNSEVVAGVVGDPSDPTSLAGRLAPGTIVIDMGSSRPESTAALAEALAARQVRLVDAPVSGGPVRARSGELAIMGGSHDAATWSEILPLLQTMGSSITRTGPVGSAHAVKALNNLLSIIGLIGATEVLSVGKQFGIDPAIMLEAINHSTGRNHATEVKIGPQVLGRGWNVGFSLDLTVKDVSTALALAETQGLRLPVSEAAVDVARQAQAWFDGTPADQSQIAEYIENINGVVLDVST